MEKSERHTFNSLNNLGNNVGMESWPDLEAPHLSSLELAIFSRPFTDLGDGSTSAGSNDKFYKKKSRF